HGHVKHLIQGLPKDTRYEVLSFNELVNPFFGALTPANAGTKNQALEILAELVTDDGIASYTALTDALDIVSPKDHIAWKSGPDEILFITVNLPNTGEVKEADVVGAAIALKARLRMVPIHTVGIHYHPYDMCRMIAERTGGIYVNLVE
ncbi:MAG: vWA domain-containing protein, partial [Planctomycetota bacterium]